MSMGGSVCVLPPLLSGLPRPQVLSLPAIVAPIKVVVLPISSNAEFEPFLNSLGMFRCSCLRYTCQDWHVTNRPFVYSGPDDGCGSVVQG